MNYLLSAFNMSKNAKEDDDSCQPLPLYDATESLAASTGLKTKVILRIRPTTAAASPLVKNKNQADIYLVQNPVSLLVRNFNSSDSARRTKANDGPTFKKFSFNQIFNLQIDQMQFFTEAVKPCLNDFLNNQNSSIIAYGSVDAGKTYTLFGPTDNPGIIPRSIEYIFSSINCTSSPCYKPEPSQGVLSLDEADRELEIQVREKLLSCRSIDKSSCENSYNALLRDHQSNNTRDIMEDFVFSLWISFIEIYNDCVYDLLQVDDDGKNMPLKLSTDKHGSTYVQGMRSVCATTGLQAYEILNAGQTRLSTVSASNYKSSRSHSIFTVRLLKYEKDSTPSAVQMSTISFYDLAGSGKLQNSMSNDKQLKESRSINTSLLAFGRCLKALTEGHSRQSTGGPFRDSKLTRLFQHSLRKENLIILINLNPSFELSAETQNVLNFAVTAIKLTSEFAKEDKRLSDYQSPISSPKHQENCPTAFPKVLQAQEIGELMTKNKQLLDEIKQLKSAEMSREYKLRLDLADFYTKQLNDLEEIWKNRMSVAEEEKEQLVKFSVDKVENYCKSRLDEHLQRKLKRVEKESVEHVSDASLSDDDNAKVADLEKLTNSMKEEIKQLSIQNEQYVFEVSWLKDNLKQITDYISSTEKCDDDLIVNDFSTKNFKGLNNDTISHIETIIAYIKRFSTKKKAVNDFDTANSSTEQVQSDLHLLLLDQYCEKIEILFHSNNMSLPQIHDSLDLSNEGLDQKAKSKKSVSLANLIDRFSRIKQLIVECISRENSLEIENNEKEGELIAWRSKNEQQDIDILRMRQQHAESEFAQLLLLKKCESLEMASKSKEFFKNPNFDADEPENSLSCALHQEIISLKQDGSYQISVVNSSSVHAESNAMRTNSDSSKNDSGVAFSLDTVIGTVTEEKYCQTENQWDEDQNKVLTEKLMQLNLDYNRMGAQHLRGSARITELSLELERISEVMLQLKENTQVKDRTINECQNKLNENKTEIDRLNAEKKQLENKFNELRDNLLAMSKNYETKLDESQVKLRVCEDEEHRVARCLKDYWEKSVNLGCELSMAYCELEKISLRCYREHVLKIHKLEEELGEKKLNLIKLNEQMSVYERDLAEMLVLSDKVDECEKALSRLQKEKVGLEKIITVRIEGQLLIQDQLQNLTGRIGQRDDQIASLKWQLETIIKENLSNSRKAKELGREVTKLLEKICTMKENITESETARTELERKSTKEIDNLRARLTIFEGNAELLDLICNSDESKQCEMDNLKLKLLEKERELEFFKKNRNATIRRYERLVQQLQKALKMNNLPSRTEKVLSFKQSYCFNDLKETRSCCIQGPDSQVKDCIVNGKNLCLLRRPGVQMLRVALERNSRTTRATKMANCLLSNAEQNNFETAKYELESSIEESCYDMVNFLDNGVDSQG